MTPLTAKACEGVELLIPTLLFVASTVRTDPREALAITERVLEEIEPLVERALELAVTKTVLFPILKCVTFMVTFDPTVKDAVVVMSPLTAKAAPGAVLLIPTLPFVASTTRTLVLTARFPEAENVPVIDAAEELVVKLTEEFPM